MIIALDFDGTLVDTMPVLEDLAVQVVQDAFPEYPELAVRRLYRQTTGDPFRVQLPYILPLSSGYNAGHWDQIAEQFEKRKREATLDAAPFSEVTRALEALSGRGYLYVVSSTRRELIELHLERCELLMFFEGVGGIGYGPKPQQLTRCKADWFIGDSNRDRRYAREAEVAFAGVCRNPRLLSPGSDTSPNLLTLAERLP